MASSKSTKMRELSPQEKTPEPKNEMGAVRKAASGPVDGARGTESPSTITMRTEKSLKK